MPEETTYAGLNITGSAIQLVEVTSGNGNIILENIGEKNYSSSIEFDNTENFAAVFRESLSGIINDNGINSRQVIASLPAELFRIFESPIDIKLHSENIADYLKWEFSILFPAVTGEIVLQPLELLPLEVGKRFAAAVVIKKEILAILKDVLENNSLKLLTADHTHSAFNHRLVTTLKPEDQFLLSLYFGNRYYSVIMLKGNSIVSFAQKPLVSGESEKEIAVKEFGAFTNRIPETEKISGIYIGSDSEPGRIAEEISAETGVAAEVFNPFRSLKIKPSLKDNIFLKSDFRKFAAACSAALRFF